MPAREYDQKDYEANPKKYRMFKTAVIARDLMSSPELKTGSIVSVEFFKDEYNAKYDVVMPIYKTRLPTWSRNDFRLLYACALCDFML